VAFLKDTIFEYNIEFVRNQHRMFLKNSSTSFLRILGSFGKFSWHWLPSRGRCVGILGGFM
jgi:hypothetical protein